MRFARFWVGFAYVSCVLLGFGVGFADVSCVLLGFGWAALRLEVSELPPAVHFNFGELS